ncbi:MAG TPA: metallophosphoesterase [Candidatus Brocadiaceae bacterium]|nr:metallophosphoesterase [Candidatus Brocadiaceae bacterium]
MISRRTFIHGACGYVLGVLSVGSYSRFLEPRWVEIKNVVIGINNLPKRFGGMSIVQLSDIHHCEYVPREFIRKCVWKVNTLSPDIIVLTGDFVYGSNAFIPSVAEELSELKSKEGVYAVLGNHDNKELTFDILSKKGIHVLINEHIPLYRKKDYLFIAGVDDLWRGNMDLDATLKGMDDKPKILLSHNPDAIEMIKHTGIDFVMAGHTHGGQVCLPLYGPPVVYSKFGARYAAGLFHEEKTIMYVNKGIGVSNFPVRFFARPEITLFTLQNSLQSV